jgi:hypothetical protein
VQNKQHELNMKQMDINRREHRADFHIRQRDNIIAELREQLELRDKIIKDKFGFSISNFLPNKETQAPLTQQAYADAKQITKVGVPQDPLGATFYQT